MRSDRHNLGKRPRRCYEFQNSIKLGYGIN